MKLVVNTIVTGCPTSLLDETLPLVVSDGLRRYAEAFGQLSDLHSARLHELNLTLKLLQGVN